MLSLHRILFPTDGSPCAEHAFARAVLLADRFGAELHVAHIASSQAPPKVSIVDTLDALTARARGIAGPDFSGTLVRAEERAVDPTVGLLDYVQRFDIDLIVMGTHGRRGVGRLMLGSVAEEIVRLADCPVLTVRPDIDPAEADTHRILVPVDFSPSSWLAVAYAQHLAVQLNAELDLLHVVETLPSYGLVDIPAVFPPPSTEVLASTQRALLDLAHEAGGPHVPVKAHVIAGHPVLGVLDTATRLRPDMIVLPSHGRRGLSRLVLGSVAEQIVRRAPSPVLVVRGDDLGLQAHEDLDAETATSPDTDNESDPLAPNNPRLSPPIQRAHPTPMRLAP